MMTAPRIGSRVYIARRDPLAQPGLVGLSGVVVESQRILGWAKIDLDRKWLGGPVGAKRHRRQLVWIRDLELLES